MEPGYWDRSSYEFKPNGEVSVRAGMYSDGACVNETSSYGPIVEMTYRDIGPSQSSDVGARRMEYTVNWSPGVFETIYIVTQDGRLWFFVSHITTHTTVLGSGSNAIDYANCLTL